jgi:hypothetical protein
MIKKKIAKRKNRRRAEGAEREDKFVNGSLSEGKKG